MSAGYRLPNPEWTGELRKCVVCGILDNPIYAGRASSDAEDYGAPIFEHRVTLEFYFGKTISDRDKKRGFVAIKLDGGRDARIRAVCVNCLDAQSAIDEVWHDFEKARRETDEKLKEPSFYSTLCSE